MKILIGVVVALAVALGLAGWALRSSWQAEASLRESLAGAQSALEQSEQQNNRLVGRFDTLDRTLTGLNATFQANQADLRKRLNTIQTIVKEPGDSDASISCLDVRVPAQLSRSVQ